MKHIQADTSIAFKGQSLSEVGIITALIAVIAISALILFGKDLTGNFNLISGGMPKEANKPVNGLSADKVAQQIAAEDALASATVSANANSAGGKGGIDSSSMSIPDFSTSYSTQTSNLTTLVESAGVNGSTQILLGQMKDIATALKATEQISDQEYANLMSVVERGYLIAQAEKMTEDHIAACKGDIKCAYDVKIVWPGLPWTPMTAGELRHEFGFTDKGAGYLMKDFVNMRNSALGSLNNPDAKKALQALSDKVVVVANNFEGNIGMIRDGYQAASSLNSISNGGVSELQKAGLISTSPDATIEIPPSLFTKKTSDQICTIGNCTPTQP